MRHLLFGFILAMIGCKDSECEKLEATLCKGMNDADCGRVKSWLTREVSDIVAKAGKGASRASACRIIQEDPEVLSAFVREAGTRAKAPGPVAPRSSGSVATSDKPVRPANVTDEMVVLADKARDAFIEFGANLEAAGKDCSKATAAVTASDEVARRFMPEFEKVWSPMFAKDRAVEAWFKANYSQLETVAQTKIKPGVDACIADPAFAKAWEQNLLMRRKPAPTQSLDPRQD